MESASDFRSLIRRPGAFAPIGMSLAALAVVAGYLLAYGAARQPDEGAAAHAWQLLVGLQVPLVAFFAIRWLPRAPRAAVGVLALQAAAVLLAAAPVYFLDL